ncbi:MAG: ACP S-malonyltransferase [Gemmatimonadales bacterium]|nr:ACP S-malonyltransferase [Gemmatimonadales bacterium]NIN11617.1 ACP S-malonyltransferase [Gemmatimonadales bacterium]NIN50223.1 ACP S-malonyltransferase [Gemmatimonadales bacterium]NIP07687.1 ACP S-malonyltransferase [Gemmatimonadales bacterium]NIR01839.1 ACP S-malonyltransferase [Gemmatimonadales bacterium]
MGKDLAERFSQARDVFEVVDEALGFALSRLMWEGPESDLTLTHNAQPAILTHSLAAYAVVRDVLQPVAGAGHSLGEYSAYVAAGTFALTDAARLVRRRGELMYQAGRQRSGSMAAVIGLPAERVVDACREASGDGAVVVAANLNAPDQVVISGDPAAVERAGTRLKEVGAKRVLPLKVSGAFHSPLMEPAELGLREELDRVEFANPSFPVIANATAELVTDASTARRLLGEQLTAPVRWAASMQRAAEEAGAGSRFVEIGPGTVLTGLLRRVVSGAPCTPLGTADQVTRFMEQHA